MSTPRIRPCFSAAWLCAVALAVASCGARTDLGGRGVDRGDVELEVCGNGILTEGEECDDANSIDTDSCLSTCLDARCGDGVLAAFESCDDGNTVNTDGCSDACTLPTCGDGIVQAGEDCDSPDLDVCTPLCRAPKCGDGFVRPGFEECDAGPSNADTLSLALLDGKTIQAITPIVRSASPQSFYDYDSASAHTGFEGVTSSNLFLYAQPSSAGLSLFTIHGIDLNSSGLSTGECLVQQTFSGLPAGTAVLLSDDQGKELAIGPAGTAAGDWKYHDNSDGGVLGGLPFPGDWTVRVDSTFTQGIQTWDYVDGDGDPITLDATFAIIEARTTPSKCRTDCTIPRCGDGTVDAGEACDDSNQSSGDGCSGDCKLFD